MGKKKHNLKGRQINETKIDNSTTDNIKLDWDNNIEYGGYDKSNQLVLPSAKRKTKVIKENKNVTRILSKKQRKNLEKIVEKKQKKQNRGALLEALASVQIPSDELKQFTSISTIQTKGCKRHKKELESGDNLIRNREQIIDDNTQKRFSSIAGCNKRKRLELLKGYKNEESEEETNDRKKKKNYNIVGLEESSSDDEDEIKSNCEEMTDLTEENNKKDEEIKQDTVDMEVEAPKLESSVNVEKTECKVPEKINIVDRKPAVYVHVDRDPKIQAARLKLPILAEEQVVMECINENSIIIIAGETGSGKTTQVPQFLYEAGYAKDKMIGITEPRRVAAISMSKRVAEEMNLNSDVVSYLIRFEGNTTDKTKIKFMTDGVLLKEIESDFMLNKYSVIILDEAHERSIYTDILVGLLSRIVPLRNKRNQPMKVIVMSATLRIEDFTENRKLFKNIPPVMKVDARQFPVTIHFNKITAEDYVKESYKKVLKIHTKLPEGGILVFLTGQQEVKYLVKKLRASFPLKKYNGKILSSENNDNTLEEDIENNPEAEMNLRKAIKQAKRAKKKLAAQSSLPRIDLDSYKLPGDDSEADLFEAGDEDESDVESESDEEDLLRAARLECSQPLWVMPLYSLLSSEKQARVFDAPPEGTRLCVIATNVAETSLTIPNVRYVVDCGRQKTRLYDPITGVSAFVVTFSSQAAANQRAGRAGRMGPGHCYRLYSSAVFNDEFEEFAIPEIQRKPVDDLVLQMKCMGVDRVSNFPFPSPPELIQLETAEHRLKLLGALEYDRLSAVTCVTPLGHAIAAFPVAPRFGKMLALSHQQNLLQYTVCLVAALSVQEVLQETGEDNEVDTVDSEHHVNLRMKIRQKRRAWVGQGNSLLLGDQMMLLRAVGASEYAGSKGNLPKFCSENGLRPKAVKEIRKLRVQLTNEINLNLNDINLAVDPQMEPPSDLQAKLLRQILLAGCGDHVARKLPQEEIKESRDRIKYKYAYQLPEMEEPVFMHSASVLKKTLPEWVIYQEVYELQNGDATKMFMRGITAIEPEWLPIYVPTMCNMGEPLKEPPPRYNPQNGRMYCSVTATFGKSAWQLPTIDIEIPISVDAYRYFAMFFLNGEICPKLLKYKNELLSTPSSMTKTWSELIPRTKSLLNILMNNEINTKEKLIQIWYKNKRFLLNEYMQWLPESAHSSIVLLWPPFA